MKQTKYLCWPGCGTSRRRGGSERFSPIKMFLKSDHKFGPLNSPTNLEKQPYLGHFMGHQKFCNGKKWGTFNPEHCDRDC